MWFARGKCGIDCLTLFGVYFQDPNAMPKSMNYKFNADEFVRLVAMAADHVRSHPLFVTSSERELNDEL